MPCTMAEARTFRGNSASEHCTAWRRPRRPAAHSGQPVHPLNRAACACNGSHCTWLPWPSALTHHPRHHHQDHPPYHSLLFPIAHSNLPGDISDPRSVTPRAPHSELPISPARLSPRLSQVPVLSARRLTILLYQVCESEPILQNLQS